MKNDKFDELRKTLANRAKMSRYIGDGITAAVTVVLVCLYAWVFIYA